MTNSKNPFARCPYPNSLLLAGNNPAFLPTCTKELSPNPWPEAELFHYRTGSGAEVDFVDRVEVLPLAEFLDELPA